MSNAINKGWWKNRIAYQVYPRSFCDANGDGTGDLKGIASKLDYLKELGVGIVWLSPVYRSPMDDGGYDISDYEDIDPLFGSMADMDELLAEAKKRDIKILMDLVVNHCSDEHPWFQKALREPDSEEAGYFWFVNSKDGAPNNWRSMFGGSAWENVGGDRYYMHLFSKKQPDLNWENPKLRQRIIDMVRFWLDKGLGGFRIDAIVHIKKMEGLPSGPADGPDGMVGCYEYTRNVDGIGKFLTELREQTFDKYECVTVAEAAGVPNGQLAEYIGEKGYFSTMFDFSYSEPYNYGHGWHTAKNPGEWDFDAWRDTLYASQLSTQKIGCGATFIENHDYPRACQKFVPEKDHCPEVQMMLGNMYFFLFGMPFIYQGQELGMTNPRFTSIEQIDDISTKNHYRTALADGLSPEEAMRLCARYSRDNARVPFPWDDSENGGFSPAGVKPWLCVHPDYKTVNAKAETSNPNGVYAFYKEMIRLRTESEYASAIQNGTFAPILQDEKQLIAYTRTGNKTIAVLCSFSDQARTVELPFDVKTLVLSNKDSFTVDGSKLTLLPYQSVTLEI